MASASSLPTKRRAEEREARVSATSVPALLNDIEHLRRRRRCTYRDNRLLNERVELERDLAF